MNATATPSTIQKRDRVAIAARAARDIPEGWYVNLGIGVPTLVADQIPLGREVIFHSENGLLGMGPASSGADADPWVANAGKQNVSLRLGASLMHHADSFAMIRGGHLDLCLLGAYEVSADGDLANWAVPGDSSAPAVGGAMDLAVGARQCWVLMDQTTRDGRSKLVEQCTYPLTASRCVNRVYTDLAVYELRQGKFFVIDMVPGLDLPHLQSLVSAPLYS